MKVVILLPWRSDGGWRDKLWVFCRERWIENFPEWQIYTGASDEGPFNRAQAINRAAEAAGDWDVALIIDGDTVSDPNAVRRAVAYALATGGLGIAHDKRVMMAERSTRQVLLGKLPQSRWAQRGNFTVTYTDSVSCAVAVARRTWQVTGGFDEKFVGWGFEDTAFEVAAQTLTGVPLRKENSTCYHLWHPLSPEAKRDSPTYRVNRDLRDRYLRSRGNVRRISAILAGESEPPPARYSPIPRILWRTVPESTPEQVEEWWGELLGMHPGWDARTVREPVDPAEFPLTGHLFDRCSSGAQKAGLIRLELLVTYGGVYVDSDVQGVRPLDALTHLPAFAAWEDETTVPDAILGSVPGHPALEECLRRAVALIEGGSQDAWETGPGVTTAVLPWRDDVLLLPPGSFYPVHYKEKNKLGSRNGQPWVFAEHKWHHSWDSKKTASNAPLELEEVDVPNDVAICIPWRDMGDERRRRAYKWCIEWWAKCGFRPIIGLGQSRAEMCNHAARQALDNGYKVLVFADADTWCPPSQIAEAARLARESAKLVLAYDTYSRLDAGATQQGLRVRPAQANAERSARMGKRTSEHVSGLVAVSVELWDRVGGFDERFNRWGFEDQAFLLACEVLGDESATRVPGVAIHWSHRADPTRTQTPDPELTQLMQYYCRAAGRVPEYGRTGKLAALGLITVNRDKADPDEMREVLAEEGGPLWARSAVS